MIPTIISERSHRQAPISRRNLSNLTTIKTLPPTPRAHTSRLSLRCLNVRNLKRKSAQFLEHISDHRPDIVAITETWLTPSDAAARVECTPPGYKLVDQIRSTRLHGGGTALLYHDRLTIKRNSSGEHQSFEFSDWTIRGKDCVSLLSTDPPTPKIILFPYPPSSQNFLLTLKPSSSAVNHSSSPVTLTSMLTISQTPEIF